MDLWAGLWASRLGGMQKEEKEKEKKKKIFPMCESGAIAQKARK